MVDETEVRRAALESALTGCVAQLAIWEVDVRAFQALEVLESNRYIQDLGNAQRQVRMFKQKITIIRDELKQLPPEKVEEPKPT